MQFKGTNRLELTFERTIDSLKFEFPPEFSSVITSPSSPDIDQTEWLFQLRADKTTHPNNRGLLREIVMTQFKKLRIIRIVAEERKVAIWTEVGIMRIAYPHPETSGIWPFSFTPFSHHDNFALLRGRGWLLHKIALTPEEKQIVTGAQPVPTR